MVSSPRPIVSCASLDKGAHVHVWRTLSWRGLNSWELHTTSAILLDRIHETCMLESCPSRCEWELPHFSCFQRARILVLVSAPAAAASRGRSPMRCTDLHLLDDRFYKLALIRCITLIVEKGLERRDQVDARCADCRLPRAAKGLVRASCVCICSCPLAFIAKYRFHTNFVCLLEPRVMCYMVRCRPRSSERTLPRIVRPSRQRYVQTLLLCVGAFITVALRVVMPESLDTSGEVTLILDMSRISCSVTYSITQTYGTASHQSNSSPCTDPTA